MRARWWVALVALAACKGDDLAPTSDSSAVSDTADSDTADSDTADSDTAGATADTGETNGLVAVDVVLVIDDSNSMASYQQQLAEAVPALIGGLLGNDPRFAVVTTTSLEGAAVPSFIGPDDPDALRSAIQVGTGGSDVEQGLRNAEAVLASGQARPEAWVSVVLLTDEEECSHYGVLDKASPEDCYIRMDELPEPADLLGNLRAALGRDNVDVHAIAGVDGGACDAWASERIAALVSQSGGTLHDICAATFDDAVQDVASSVDDRLAGAR